MARPVFLCALFVGVVFTAGCGTDPIAVYQVPKSRAIETPAPTHRLFGAILPHGDEIWFFKTIAGEEALRPHLDAIAGLVTSIHFGADGKAKWTLPTDWRQLPGVGPRTATLQFGSPTAPLEMTVTELAKNEDDDAAMLANVNRWRGQMMLPPSSTLGDIKETKTGDGQRVLLVNLAGRLNVKAMPPMAGRVPPPAAPSAIPPAGPAEENERVHKPAPVSVKYTVKYTAPAGWTSQESNTLQKAKFVIEVGGKRAAADISSFSTSAPLIADPLANVNRWRGQIGLTPVNAETLAKLVKPMKVAGFDAKYVEIISDANAPSPRAIMAAMFTAYDEVWFVKWAGDAALVESQRAAMASFLGSLQLVKE